MEPPAKRLRILQSVDVDETNPDYVNAKQKQQQKFKGTLESIFAKYENMHESMSDEIDLRQGKMVVDRGHLRRLARQANREETVLLNSLALGTGPEPEDDSEKEGGIEDSEDELAPTQPVALRSAQKEKKRRRSTAADEAHSLSSNSVQPEKHSKTSVSTAIAQTGIQTIPQTPNPVTNLLQFVQFPQTPAGQQARSSFYTTLTQTINYAVHQTVAPLLSGILPNTPNAQLPFANVLSLQTTPIPSADNVAPARDPKWFFPPLSNESHMDDVAQSSPVPAPATSATALGESTQEEPCIPESDPQQEPNTDDDVRMETIPTAAMVQMVKPVDMGSKQAIRRTSPRVEIQRKTGRQAKHAFTEEDDVYICTRRVLHNRTWTEIRDSKDKWKSWPLSTFQQHWRKHLRGRNLHMKGHSALELEQDDSTTHDDETVTVIPHHLPTPSSSGHEDDNTPVLERAEPSTVAAPSSSVQFDDDEHDLLSLAGADLSGEQLPLGTEEEEAFFPDADETILPSVEQTTFVDEDLLQQVLLDDSASEEMEKTPPVKIKSEVPQSPPMSSKRRTRAAIAYQAAPETDADPVSEFQDGHDQVSQEKDVSVCDVCYATFTSLRGLRIHQAHPRSTHNKTRPKSPSIDLVGDDELQADIAITPKIKRDFSTPPPTSFVFSTPAAQSRSRPDVSSSGIKSASGLDRRAYLKQVKQSWSKKSTPAPKALSKSKSFHTLLRKRDWVEVAESDDELAF